MKYRPVDENGDMLPVLSLKDMKEDREAVYLAVYFRLRLNQGEWWEDEDLGFRMWPYLINSAKAGQADFLMNYISSYIMETEGVSSIENVSVTYKDRRLTYNANINTIYGKSELEVEVGEYELLRASY